MYPEALLPKSDYIKKIDTNCLIDKYDFYLQRRIDADISDAYDEDFGIWETILFDYKDIPGLSLNLLCKKCDEKSTSFRAINEGLKDWDGSLIIDSPIIGEHYEEKSIFCNAYFRISQVHNLEFDVTYPTDKGTKKDLKSRGILITLTESFNDYGESELKGRGIISVVHKPNNINYWHFQLEIFAENKIIERDKLNKRVKAALTVLSDRLSKIPPLHTPKDNKIFDPTNCYYK